jgi:DNA-binding NarL/FixJ family response regulator
MLLQHVADIARSAPGSAAAGALTAREREILRLIDEGLSNKQIAVALHIGLPTVKNHVHHILEKLQVRRRAEAAALLRR